MGDDEKLRRALVGGHYVFSGNEEIMASLATALLWRAVAGVIRHKSLTLAREHLL